MEVASKNEGRVIERCLTSKPPIYAPWSKEDISFMKTVILFPTRSISLLIWKYTRSINNSVLSSQQISTLQPRPTPWLQTLSCAWLPCWSQRKKTLQLKDWRTAKQMNWKQILHINLSEWSLLGTILETSWSLGMFQESWDGKGDAPTFSPSMILLCLPQTYVWVKV